MRPAEEAVPGSVPAQTCERTKVSTEGVLRGAGRPQPRGHIVAAPPGMAEGRSRASPPTASAPPPPPAAAGSHSYKRGPRRGPGRSQGPSANSHDPRIRAARVPAPRPPRASSPASAGACARRRVLFGGASAPRPRPPDGGGRAGAGAGRAGKGCRALAPPRSPRVGAAPYISAVVLPDVLFRNGFAARTQVSTGRGLRGPGLRERAAASRACPPAAPRRPCARFRAPNFGPGAGGGFEACAFSGSAPRPRAGLAAWLARRGPPRANPARPPGLARHPKARGPFRFPGKAPPVLPVGVVWPRLVGISAGFFGGWGEALAGPARRTWPADSGRLGGNEEPVASAWGPTPPARTSCVRGKMAAPGAGQGLKMEDAARAGGWVPAQRNGPFPRGCRFSGPHREPARPGAASISTRGRGGAPLGGWRPERGQLGVGSDSPWNLPFEFGSWLIRKPVGQGFKSFGVFFVVF